jgi:excisionase family DNA binding protein
VAPDETDPPVPHPGPERRPARLALTKAEAADSLGVSVDFLERHVVPELRVVRRGRRRLIPLRELERWLDQNAEPALGPRRC